MEMRRFYQESISLLGMGAMRFPTIEGSKAIDEIKAGDLLGYMGDTGYSTTEGTKGKFPVHLHMGIYIDKDGQEISVNPYAALKYTEEKIIDYQER